MEEHDFGESKVGFRAAECAIAQMQNWMGVLTPLQHLILRPGSMGACQKQATTSKGLPVILPLVRIVFAFSCFSLVPY